MKPDFTIKGPVARKPAGILRLFTVPWSSAQTDTMIFTCKKDQEYYFTKQFSDTTPDGTAITAGVSDSQLNHYLNSGSLAYQKKEFNQMRPFRIGEPFRVNDTLINCMRYNYFSYYDDLSKRWWYGFITNAQWVNQNLTQITYDVDPIQSFMFDCILDNGTKNALLNNCIVERETTKKDGYFYNQFSEDVSPATTYQKVINTFTLLNSNSNTTSYYLFIAKYYLFGEDLGCDSGSHSATTSAPTTDLYLKEYDNGVKWWKEPQWYSTPPYYWETYGHSKQTLFYYVIPTGDVEKALRFIQELQSGMATAQNHLWYNDLSDIKRNLNLDYEYHTSNMSNLLAIIPIPSSMVKQNSSYYEAFFQKTSLSTEQLKYWNKKFFHVDDPRDSAITYDNTDAITWLKNCITDIWPTLFYKQYTLRDPYYNLLENNLYTIKLPVTPKNYKTFCNDTLSVKITGCNQTVDIPISKLIKSTTSTTINLSLYIYASLSNTLKVIISSCPISDWSTGKADSIHELLLVSNALPGCQYINDGTTQWMQTAYNNTISTLSMITKLMPDMDTISLLRMSNPELNDPEVKSAYRKYKQAELNERDYAKANSGDWMSFNDYQYSDYEDFANDFNSAIQTREKTQQIYNDAKRLAKAATPMTTKLGKIAQGLSFAVNTVSEISANRRQCKANRQSVLNSLGTVISSTSELTPYNLGWPEIIITMPSEKDITNIDNYFNSFGYAVNEYKKPNLFQRTKWDYIKTSNLIVGNNAPENARLAIAQTFNNGIRLHHIDYHKDLTVENAMT